MLDRVTSADPAGLESTASDAAAAKREARARAVAADLCVARRVREARIVAGLSQAAIGAALGVTHQQVQKYETTRNCLSPGQIAILAPLLERPLAWFYGARESEVADWVVRVAGQFVRGEGCTPWLDEADLFPSGRALAEAERYEDAAACPASDFAGDAFRSRASLLAELATLRAAGEGAAHG